MPLEHILAMYYKSDCTKSENDEQDKEKSEHNTESNKEVGKPEKGGEVDDTQDEDNPFLNQRITRGCT